MWHRASEAFYGVLIKAAVTGSLAGHLTHELISRRLR
jgi:hypothetical protein